MLACTGRGGAVVTSAAARLAASLRVERDVRCRRRSSGTGRRPVRLLTASSRGLKLARHEYEREAGMQGEMLKYLVIPGLLTHTHETAVIN